VSSTDLIQPVIYTSNGVLHLVSSLPVPPSALQSPVDSEKYLLAINCTYFVSLLRSVGLRSLINDTETKILILAPRDDVLQACIELKKLLQYHFLSGKFARERNALLEEEGFGGGKQVLSIEVASDNKKSSPLFHFGGAGIIGRAPMVA
jgi:solute carrier family 25 (mitochondrial carnitine/acylcarnitine transporter), member 20/29